MAEVPVLICIAGKLVGERFPILEGGLDLGRAPENGVVVIDEGVSRFHARILFDNGQLWLQDAGSRNGVFVNDGRVTQHQNLKIGDEVRIADHRFLIKLEAESQLPGSTGAPAPPRTSGGDAPTSSDEQPRPRRRWFWPFS